MEDIHATVGTKADAVLQEVKFLKASHERMKKELSTVKTDLVRFIGGMPMLDEH